MKTLLIAALLGLPAAPVLAAEETALPLDLAYWSREVPRHSPGDQCRRTSCGVELRTPPVKTADAGEELETRFLPSGLRSDYAGRQLWVSETRTGASRPVCAENVVCWRGSWSPSSRQLAFYSDEGGHIGLWLLDFLARHLRSRS